MEKRDLLEANHYYKIILISNNGENLFPSPENCPYFLTKMYKHLSVIGKIVCYNLLSDRVNLIIKIKPVEQLPLSYVSKIYQPISNLCNAYTKAINIRYGRKGSLFQVRFERKVIWTPEEIKKEIMKIHDQNLPHLRCNSLNILLDSKPTCID